MAASKKREKPESKLPRNLVRLIGKNAADLRKIFLATEKIKKRLLRYGKKMKGDELVGGIGEVYGKIFLEKYFSEKGKLVEENLEYDLTTGRRRVSIKTRKGRGTGWQQTSAIPEIKGKDRPTHLMFIHLDDDYQPLEVWLYPWKEVQDRAKKHRVRRQHRSFIFMVKPKQDQRFMLYGKPQKDFGLPA